MTRKNTPKKGLTRTRFPIVGVKNPGSKPGKWNKTMAYRAMFLAQIGLTEKEIAVAVDVNIHSINYWKRTKPEFLEALQKGKLEYTERVEQALVESAVGYSHPDTHFAVVDGVLTQTPIIKHYPPNTTAMMFYLSNRARGRWMDSRKVEGTINHRHVLDLTNLSDEQLNVLEEIGLTGLPEHGSNVD